MSPTIATSENDISGEKSYFTTLINPMSYSGEMFIVQISIQINCTSIYAVNIPNLCEKGGKIRGNND
jgi:hypothetical protein